jgi:acyl-CoA thioesterase-2
MSSVLEALVEQLALERIEENLFRGQSKDLGWGTVFGGQVLGQALSAAVQTVPSSRHVHSLHSYFLRPGNVNKPIVYEVDRIRDGRSFTTRRVVAIQSGEAIFNLAASFHEPESGFDHQAQAPEAPTAESLKTEQELAAPLVQKLPAMLRERAVGERAFETRPVDPDTSNPFAPTPREASRMVWFKATSRLPDDPALHSYLLAYVSDHSFMTTSLMPHGVSWLTPGVQVASIDHVLWYHRPFRVDEWLLYVIDSPSAFGGRGLARGQIFTQDGTLVASAAQEGLIRQRK